MFLMEIGAAAKALPRLLCVYFVILPSLQPSLHLLEASGAKSLSGSQVYTLRAEWRLQTNSLATLLTPALLLDQIFTFRPRPSLCSASRSPCSATRRQMDITRSLVSMIWSEYEEAPSVLDHAFVCE